jgi:hypothetical protein
MLPKRGANEAGVRQYSHANSLERVWHEQLRHRQQAGRALCSWYARPASAMYAPRILGRWRSATHTTTKVAVSQPGLQVWAESELSEAVLAAPGNASLCFHRYSEVI